MLRILTLGLAVVAAPTMSALAADSAALEILPRVGWKAKPGITKLMKSQTPREIIIHHTSVKQQPKISLERKMRGLQGFSQRTGKVGKRKKPAWGDVPYHYYIGVSGRIAEGRNINYAGDTNTRYSTKDRVQVVLEGYFDKEKPNASQLGSLKALTVWLSKKYNVPADKITGHNDHASTDCPGKHLKVHLPAIRTAVTNAAE